MSKKDLIYEGLKSVEENSFYGWTDVVEFPRCIFYLVSNFSKKLSNKRHVQHVSYQVSYYSDIPLNIENDAKLWGIIDALEERGIITNDWREIIDRETDKNRTIYHYWLEAR